MAQVKTDHSIVHIRGRYGGVYFKRGSPSQHIQAMPRHVNYARHGVQLRYTGAYTMMSFIWAMVLVAGFSLLWLAFALAWLFRKKGKEPKKISGYNWFIHYGLTREETDAPPFWKPPPSPSRLPDFYAVVEGMKQYHIAEHLWPLYFCGGYYYYEGTFNGRPWFKDPDRLWYIWWKDPMWVISKTLGFEEPQTTSSRMFCSCCNR
ncbi:unnamed protein product [marine sediment metagenome]|uniref:Uncharacterized protein n=1 Tax=marine sediment metagenome TaxID=412755 RepID=X1HED7_9ZZZZ